MGTGSETCLIACLRFEVRELNPAHIRSPNGGDALGKVTGDVICEKH